MQDVHLGDRGQPAPQRSTDELESTVSLAAARRRALDATEAEAEGDGLAFSRESPAVRANPPNQVG